MQRTRSLIRLFLAGLISLALKGQAQVSESTLSQQQLVYRNWDNQVGLPQNTVTDVVKDKDGFLWVATEEGLARFDGSEFSLYNEAKIDNLHSNNFTDISTAGNTVWAASRNTILAIERNKVKAIDFRKHLTNAWIKCIEVDASGRVWVGTTTGALYYMQKDSVYKWQNEVIGGGGSIEVLRSFSGGILVGTSKGLFQIHQSGNVSVIPEYNGDFITAIAISKQQEVWVGTADKGLHLRLGNKEILHLSEKQGLKESYISSLAVGARGEVWIGTRSSGFQVYENGKLHSPDQKKYAHDGIRSILHTDEQITWLGTNASGLVQIKPAQIQMFTTDKVLTESIILPIYQHPNGDVWVGTAGKGLHRFSNGKKTTFTRENGLSNNLVLSIYSAEEYVFIGTALGLNRFNLKTGKIDKVFTKEDGLATNSVQAIFYDSQKRLWLSTRSGGIQLLKEGNRIEKKALPATFSNTSFLAIFEDRLSNIWFGSRGGGMLRQDADGNITHYNQAVGFKAEIAYSFWEDVTGRLWVSTEKGLYCYYKGQFTLFDKSAGLEFNEIYRILEDDKGYLWLTGNFGLQRVALTDLYRYQMKMDTEKPLSVRFFNTIDGMANAEANGGFTQAGWKMHNGNLWFPTVQGVAIVNPIFINEKIIPVDIHLQLFQYGDKAVGPEEKIKVPPNVNSIEISYACIDFSKAADITYYYRLKGLNSEWTNVGNRRVAYFTGLTPGTYTFEVKAEQYGQWSPIQTLDFTIEPYFYQSTWFKIGLLILCLLIVYVLVLIQKRKEGQKVIVAKNITKAQIVGQEKERQVIGEELHDNINQQLATVKLYLDFARTSENDRIAMIERSEKVVHNVIDEIRALCKRLTPPTLKDIGLADALLELFDSYRVVKKFEVHYQGNAPLNDLEEGIQFSVFRILQELLQNIDKHTQATNVWVDIENTKNHLVIKVRDNGQGFNVKKRTIGTGFTNIKNRLELYSGLMEVDSALGAGCLVSITLPLNKVEDTVPWL